MTLSVIPFEAQHLEGVALLLAQRHARDRARETALPVMFESADATRPLLDRDLHRPGAAGVVALRDGEPAGFLLSTAMLPRPEHFLAQFFPPRSMLIAYHGHALASREDASLYRELYAGLAGGWVERGFFDHFLNVPAQDAEGREAWDSLGFGRDTTCAMREVEQPVVPSGTTTGVEVHQAGPEDVEVIEGLADALWRHHVGSPIFAPHLRETDEHMREMTVGLLADPSNAHFVAYDGDEPLGMNTFMPPSFLSPMETPEACVYLFQGIVYAQARGGGVGKTLLAHAMDWANQQGHRWCALHFAAPNPSGAAFWQANGFRPFEHRLRRHIDERIVWAGA